MVLVAGEGTEGTEDDGVAWATGGEAGGITCR
jgi:hypothetical protein